MRLNPVVCIIYCIMLYFFNLARTSIGDVFVFLYYLFIAMPIVSLLHALLSLVFLRYIQDFDTFHRVRGDSVNYQLKLSNELPFASANIRVKFKIINPNIESEMSDINVSLGAGANIKKQYDIPCPYLGIYTIGLDSLRVSDVLNWISFDASVFFYTMYVYPRVFECKDMQLNAVQLQHRPGNSSGASVDYSYFERLDEYKPGDNIHLMAWKRFSTQGIPLLRRYKEVSSPGLILYLDSRRDEDFSMEVLEREDFSLELAVTIADVCLQRNTPVLMRFIDQEPAMLRQRGDLGEILPATLKVNYESNSDILALYKEDLQHGVQSMGSMLIITHRLSREMILLLAGNNNAGSGSNLELVVNETNSSSVRKAANRDLVKNLGSRSNRVHFSQSGDINNSRLRWN